jgi:hypothetical protein
MGSESRLVSKGSDSTVHRDIFIPNQTCSTTKLLLPLSLRIVVFVHNNPLAICSCCGQGMAFVCLEKFYRAGNENVEIN